MPSDVGDTRSLERLQRRVPRGVRQGRHPALRRRDDQARRDARHGRGGLDADPRNQPHRHAPQLPGVRARHGGAPLRADHHDRVAVVVRRPLRGRRLRGEQVGGRGADARAGGRVGAARRHRQRHRARRLQDGPERRAARRRHAARSSSRARRCTASDGSTSSSARRCFSRRMPRRSSPATCWPSTAASSRAGSTSESGAGDQRARQRRDGARGAGDRPIGRGQRRQRDGDRDDCRRTQDRAAADPDGRGRDQVRQPDRAGQPGHRARHPRPHAQRRQQPRTRRSGDARRRLPPSPGSPNPPTPRRRRRPRRKPTNDDRSTRILRIPPHATAGSARATTC